MSDYERRYKNLRESSVHHERAREVTHVFRCNPDESAGMAEQAATEVLQTYTLQLLGPRINIGPGMNYIGAPFLRYLYEAEENLTDLLPEGYSVRILEWDAEEEES